MPIFISVCGVINTFWYNLRWLCSTTFSLPIWYLLVCTYLCLFGSWLLYWRWWPSVSIWMLVLWWGCGLFGCLSKCQNGVKKYRVRWRSRSAIPNLSHDIKSLNNVKRFSKNLKDRPKFLLILLHLKFWVFIPITIPRIIPGIMPGMLSYYIQSTARNYEIVLAKIFVNLLCLKFWVFIPVTIPRIIPGIMPGMLSYCIQKSDQNYHNLLRLEFWALSCHFLVTFSQLSHYFRGILVGCCKHFWGLIMV